MKAIIERPADQSSGWVLNINRLVASPVVVTIAGEGSIKHYRRKSAAIADAHRIGFREVTIRLPDNYKREDEPRNGALK